MDDLAALLKQARTALKAGETETAIRLYRQAQPLSPRDPEIPHELGIALVEKGEVGLAAFAQGQALALDSAHIGARAQRAAALAALGDDEGAARDLREVLQRLGPQPSLSARLYSLEQAAKDAASRRLIGSNPARLSASPLIGSALARNISDPLSFRAPFAELHAEIHDGKLSRLDLVFDSMDASLGRSDVSYGGTTEDEYGRRVPLDEFTAAGIAPAGCSRSCSPKNAVWARTGLPASTSAGPSPVRTAPAATGSSPRFNQPNPVSDDGPLSRSAARVC